jgi:hypothetical protein
LTDGGRLYRYLKEMDESEDEACVTVRGGGGLLTAQQKVNEMLGSDNVDMSLSRGGTHGGRFGHVIQLIACEERAFG